MAGRPAIDPAEYQRAIAHRERMLPALHLMKNLAPTRSGVSARGINIGYTQNRWEFIGPRNLDASGAFGPAGSLVAGRVNGVAWDNRTPGVAYAAAASGGVWKTTNYGTTWTPLGDGFPSLPTSSVVVDPTNSRILYVGLGDFFASYAGFANPAGKPALGFGTTFGIMKSVNGGNTFINLGRQLGLVSAIVVDPDNPRIVTASTDTGLFRSTDGGTTWALVSQQFYFYSPTFIVPAPWSSIRVYNPYNRPRTSGVRPYFASCLGIGILRSLDRGATWQRIPAPLAYNNDALYLTVRGNYALNVEPSAIDPNVIYVMDGNESFSDGRIFRGVRNANDTSARPAYTWTDVTGNYLTNDSAFNNWDRAAYSLSLNAVPVQLPDRDNPFNLIPADLLYGGTRELSASINGEPDWQRVTKIFTIDRQSHPDQRDVRYNPFNSVDQLLANDGGVYSLFYDPDQLDPWFVDSSLNATLGIAQFYSADFDAFNPGKVLGGTATLASVRSNGNLNTSWSVLSFGYLYGGYSAINPSNTNEQYTTLLNGATSWQGGRTIAYTPDNWESAYDISPDQIFPGNPTVYNYPYSFNSDSSVYSAFTGQAQAIFPFLKIDPFAAGAAPGVAVNPLYMGTNGLWRFDPPPAFKPTTAATQSPGFGQWRRVGTTNFSTTGLVTAIAFANAGSRIYVGTSDGRVWVTADRVTGQDSGRDEDLTGNLIARWLDITANLAPPVTTPPTPPPAVTSISVNPTQPGDILVTLAGGGAKRGVWRCQDTTAANILYTDQNGLANDYTHLPAIDIYDLTRDPKDPINTWFVASPIGVFTTTDKGSTWFDATRPLGLPNVEVTSIQAVSQTGYLNVATFGRGIWRFDLDSAKEERNPADVGISYTLSRSGDTVFAVVTLKNAVSTPSKKVGPAENVQALVSTLTLGKGAPLAGAGLPVVLGAIGPGTTKAVTVTFDGTKLPAGDAVTFSISYSYISAGTPVTRAYSVRTRLP